MNVTQGFSGTYTATRYCDGLRQPCPNPHQCATDCQFNTAEKCCTGDCDQGRACIDLPITMYEPTDVKTPKSFWLVVGWAAIAATWAAVVVAYLARFM